MWQLGWGFVLNWGVKARLSLKYSLHYSQQALQSRAVLLIDYADRAQLTNTVKEWQAGLRWFLTHILAQKAEDWMARMKTVFCFCCFVCSLNLWFFLSLAFSVSLPHFSAFMWEILIESILFSSSFFLFLSLSCILFSLLYAFYQFVHSLGIKSIPLA